MFEHGSQELIILSSGILMILILLSLLGNLLVIFAVYYSRNLRARVNYLIVSLAMADILVALTAMPIWMMFEITSFTQATAKLLQFGNFMDMLCGIASIGNLTAISYERLWSVYSPLKHRRYLTNIIAGSIIFCVWAYAFFVAGTSMLWQDWTEVTLYTASTGFFFPLFLIFIAYTIIMIIVNRSARNVISSQDNTRINRTICIIVGLFVICWAPHFITSILIFKCASCFEYITSNLWIRTLFKCLHYSNSCLNPLVYGIANAQYKEAFKVVFKKICFNSLFRKEENNSQIPTRPTFLNHPSDTSKLFVELTPEDKEPNGARGGFNVISENEDERYLPGDYRALPILPSHREVRWHGETPESIMMTASSLDSDQAIKKALLDPNSLHRTSYI